MDEKLLSKLSSDLRTERFNSLKSVSNGLLSDTWYHQETDSLRYWPGGSFEYWFYDLTPGEKQVLDTFCMNHNYTCIGVGSGRIVLKSITESEIVVKVARYGVSARLGDGRRQNKIEFDRWKKVCSKPLLPIYEIGTDYSWVTCPLAKPLDMFDESELEKHKETICNEIKEELTQYDSLFLLDIGSDNVGLVDGDWCWLDYGQPDITQAQMYGLFPSAL